MRFFFIKEGFKEETDLYINYLTIHFLSMITDPDKSGMELKGGRHNWIYYG